MRKPSGDLHIVDYKTRRVIATIQPEDYIEDLRHWEIKNSVDILDFKVLESSPYAVYLQQQNLVLKEVRSGVIVPYVITEIEKDSASHLITVYASGEWTLLDKDSYFVPQRLESWTAKQYLDFATARTEWLVGNLEAKGTRTHTIKEFTSPLKLIHDASTLFDNMETQYRVIIQGGEITKKYIDLVEKRGRETGKEVTLGKDLLGVKRVENSENIITALVPYVMGQDEDGKDKFITIESVNNGLQYIVDEDAYQRWNVNGKHLFGFYTPETEDQDMTPQRLLTLAKTELRKRVQTIVTYEVDAVDASHVFGLDHEQINEGDTITIIDRGMNPPLYLEARAIAGDESHKDPRQNKYTFGNYREIVNQDDALRRMYQKMLTMVQDKVSKEWFDALEEKVTETNNKVDTAVKESQAAKDLAEATKDYMEQNLVDIIESVNPPTANLNPNKTLWRDISGGKPGILKIWTGTAWESVVPDTGPLQKSIKDAENEINTLKETVKDIPDKTWLNQQLEGKADKSGVYMKDYIDQNVVGKQIYETDKQGNIKNFTDLRTDVDRNAQEITNKAEKTVVNQLGNDLASVSQTANTAKQNAEGNTQTITQLDTRFKGMKIGRNNLIENSGNFSDTSKWIANNTGATVEVATEDGFKCLKVKGTAKQSISYKLKPSTEYVFSAEIKLPIDHTMTVSSPLHCWTTIGTNPHTATKAVITPANNSIIQAGIWARVAISIKTLAEGETTFTPFLYSNELTTAMQYSYIKYMQILEGNKLIEDWTPPASELVSTGEFTKKTNEIINTVGENSQTISKVQQDQGTMQSTLNQVKQTTDLNSQNITTLTQTQGQQGPIIQQNTSDITQLNNQIKSKVTDIQMQDYVGGLGSTNVLFNAAFEDRVINATTGIVTSRTPSTTKWSVVGTGSGITIVPESARHHDGYNSVKITATGQTASKWSGIMQRVPAVQNGGDYVFSAWVYVQDKNTLDGGGAIKLQFFNGANAVSTFAQTEIKELLVNNSWTLVSVKITAPNLAITHLQGDIWVRQNGTMWVAQPQLQQGSTRSTFMENPKDYANYDQLVGEVAKKVATSDFNSKVSTIETSINQQSKSIELKAEKTDVYTKTEANGQFGSKAIVDTHTSTLSVMSDEINLRVKSGDVASTINQTAQSVLIQADKIYLNGYIEAKHLKAQTLQGVTIQTAPAGSGANQIRLNAQNMTLHGSGQARGYLGFINRTDSNITSALILGNDYTSAGSLDGSLVIDQTTITGNQWTNSVASIGIATGRNGNDIAKKSYINFYRYNGNMDIRSEGSMELFTSNGDIEIDASSSGSLHGFVNIKASKDIDMFAKRGQYRFFTSDNLSMPAMTLVDRNPTSSGDVDLTLGNLIMFRISRDINYIGDGIQLKSAMGDAFRDMKLRTLRAIENISAQGRMYALEFVPTSTRKIKTNIEDLPFSALEKVNSVSIKCYNLISDVEKYNAGEIDALPVNYGMIAEDTDGVFTTPEKNAVTLYSSVSISMQAIQEVDVKVNQNTINLNSIVESLRNTDTRVDELEKELEVQKLREVDQEKRITDLEELVQKMINGAPITENTTQTEQP
ncbi:peptidase S74 (plasmid) [Bacillus mycoides]|uniref:Peptidase S74 n=1 Tax=Bacillus mycoides TaxID=1405 RepID=A0A1W6AJL6_BACMY|nr:phage tail spike protein [Bacillus mycoides]ARJ26056.1 peptidase S74 [Bacillus mycoides]